MVLALRAFYVIGPILVVWAVVLSIIGITRPAFPRQLNVQRIVIAISALLVIGVILSATIGAKFEHTEQVKTGPAAHGHRGEGG